MLPGRVRGCSVCRPWFRASLFIAGRGLGGLKPQASKTPKLTPKTPERPFHQQRCCQHEPRLLWRCSASELSQQPSATELVTLEAQGGAAVSLTKGLLPWRRRRQRGFCQNGRTRGGNGKSAWRRSGTAVPVFVSCTGHVSQFVYPTGTCSLVLPASEKGCLLT
jgi:hypothetical protein